MPVDLTQSYFPATLLLVSTRVGASPKLTFHSTLNHHPTLPFPLHHSSYRRTGLWSESCRLLSYNLHHKFWSGGVTDSAAFTTEKRAFGTTAYKMASSPTTAGGPAVSRMPFQEDDSPSPSPAKRPGNDALTKSYNPSFDAMNEGSTNAQEESDDESDLDIRRPLGRAARRMLGGDASTHAQSSPPQASRRDQQSDDDEDLYSATPRKTLKSPSVPASEARSGLFVSPARPGEEDSDDELPTNPLGNSKLAALVAEKRKARLAREARQEQERQELYSDAHGPSGSPDELQEDANPDIERIMSDAAPPTRKASKKALLEMERETQRISRQQALAHQMKVRRKFTTSDLFARFHYHPKGEPTGPSAADGDNTASSVPNSDAAESVQKELPSTPPSSPPTPLDRQRALVEMGALSKLELVRQDSLASLGALDDDEELPDMAQILSSSRPAPPKEAEPVPEEGQKKGLKLARLGKKAMPVQTDDSDDDLEIVKDLPAHLSVFDKAKGIQRQHNGHSTAIHTLKHLAHIGADAAPARRKKGASRSSVNPQVLEAQLRLRAKEQARAQQLERIAELKAKGVEIQTTEEREREQEEYENLLEKARQEAVELRKAEKAAAKGVGPHDAKAFASDDESEDGDYTEMSEDEEEQNEDLNGKDNELVDDAADESEGEEEDEEEDGVEGDDQDELAGEDEQEDVAADAPSATKQPSEAPAFALSTPLASRKPRKPRVIVDDEDESDAEDSRPLQDQEAAESDDPFAAFGFGAAKSASSLMSPTQAFNATMQTPTQATQQQDSMDELNYLAPPTSSSLPPLAMQLDSQMQADSQVSAVPGSQVPESQQVNLIWETQAPETPMPGLNREGSNATLETPDWEPSQDVGLPSPWQTMPSLRRENTLESVPEHETQSTVPVRISESPAPQAARKRLVRGQRALVESSDDEAAEAGPPTSKPKKKDAFREMARKRKEAMTAAEREEMEREMKQMMEEQAEESEDEYAGLGGDDFVAPETEQDRAIIDSSHVDVDERQLAALFAERQRAADEAEAQKLYKDITTGGLRRKQANMFDLDEDEDDLAVRRRQMRQREEARKRKLLLQDDNIAGLAEGKHSKGRDAFLKAIADDDDRDDDILDLSDDGEDESSATQTDSQKSQQVDATTGPLRPISGNKRRLENAPEGRPPAKERRTQASAFRAPTSLAEVRESVSFLLDEPHAPTVGPSVLEVDSESDKEDVEEEQQQANDDEDAVQEEVNRQNDGGYAPDRIAMPPPRLPASQRRTAAKPAVVDRLSLKRGSSATESAHSRTAWAAPANGGFKVPSLLRRATTNTAFNTNERGISTSNGISKDVSGVKMGGSKKSSLAYQARTQERNKIVEASAKRRDENRARIAQLRRAASSGFGKEIGGHFE